MKKLTILLLALLVIFSATSISSTYAYWNRLSRVNDTSINIGTWSFAATWSPTAVYKTGDLVTWNGKTYKALRTSTHKEPGKNGSQNFWVVQ